MGAAGFECAWGDHVENGMAAGMERAAKSGQGDVQVSGCQEVVQRVELASEKVHRTWQAKVAQILLQEARAVARVLGGRARQHCPGLVDTPDGVDAPRPEIGDESASAATGIDGR